MRPYLALIKDSFRAAIASSVLYVLLAVITLLLLVLAPLHVREALDWKLQFGNNVTKIDQLSERLIERGKDPKHPTVNRVWDMLDEQLQLDLILMVAEKEKAAKAEVDPQTANRNFMTHRRITNNLEKALNEIIESKDFYDEEAWAKKRLSSEARELLKEDRESLSDERHRRLNRLLMASAFGGIVNRGSGNALELCYAFWHIPDMTFPVSYNEFANTTLQLVTWFFDKFVMSIGLFIAILVTANFIPETFLPGSLNLLMSKPVSRWGLLISKFVGGCAFVSLCAVYLFVGLWLWLGFAMGIWDPSILWGIPIYIVVFAIYYSVSTFIGVWARSPILSVIVTALFWAACFVVGLTFQMADGRINNSRSRGLVAVGDKILHIGELNAVETWNDNTEEWDKNLEIKMMAEQRVAIGGAMFIPGAGDDSDLNLIGPVYDQKRNVVLSGIINLGNPGSISHQELFIASGDNLEFQEIGKFPRGAIKAVSDTDGIIVFAQDGRFRRYIGKADPNAEGKDNEEKSGLGSLEGALLKGKEKNKKEKLFEEIGPEKRITLDSPRSVAFNQTSRKVFIFKDDTITQFVLNSEGKYETGKSVSLTSSETPFLASGGKTLVAALPNGRVVIFDEETLTEQAAERPQDKSPFRSVINTSDGRYYAFLCRNRTLWLLDNESTGKIKMAPIPRQGSVTATEFDQQNRLWIATRSNKVQLINLENSSSEKTFAPPTGWLTKAHEYLLSPMYWLFPKPGEFYKLVSYLSVKPDVEEEEGEPKALVENTDPWQPLWGGLLFMCAVLFITCLIFQYRDF